MVALATEVGAKKFSSEEETFSDLSILIFENNFKARCTAAAAHALLKSALFSPLPASVPGCCHCAAVLTGTCMGLLQGIQTQFDVYHEAVETAAPEVRAHFLLHRLRQTSFHSVGAIGAVDTPLCAQLLPLCRMLSMTRLQVHERVDEAFERAFESLEPYLNKTGELGGVTPYSEVGFCVMDHRLRSLHLYAQPHGAWLA